MSKLLVNHLQRKSNKIFKQLMDLRHTAAFSKQKFDTQTDLYETIDKLKTFIDNIS